MHNVQTSIDDFVERLKTRYLRDNAVLDLLALIEMLREENVAARNEGGRRGGITSG